MEFSELIEAVKTRFPNQWDHDEACSFFNRIDIDQREKAFEYLKECLSGRTLPVRSKMISLVSQIGIRVTEFDTGNTEWEIVCQGCRARRPMGKRVCPGCGSTEIGLARSSGQQRAEHEDERMATPQELDEFSAWLKTQRVRPSGLKKVSEWTKEDRP